MAQREFGLPIFPVVGGRPDLVRDVSGLQVYREFLVGRFGPEFASVPLQSLVAAVRGWDWQPAQADCPVGQLRYSGSANLPPRATVDPAQATTACLAPPVVLEALPAWQQPLWASRPLNESLFDRLSAVDVDRGFLMGVVRNGVLLVRDISEVPPFALPNYSSALEAEGPVSAVVADEVAKGWVVPVLPPLRFVHPLGAVPKGEGDVRVIHDHSVPIGVGVNDHEVYVRYTWDSLDLAVRYLVPHAYMARLDISAYYRHFMVHPSQWELQGFEWGGVSYVDTRVQFGLRLAPELAHRFTMFLKRVFHANGLMAVVGVMDDYLLIHLDREACLLMLVVAAALLADLGFSVNFKPGKTVLPAKLQKFVGVVINSARFTLSLPLEKLSVLLEGVAELLGRRKVGRKDLQRLVGRMQWAAKVVYGGRAFMRSLLDGLSTMYHPGHHVRVSSLMRADLRWWLEHASLHNGQVSLAPASPAFFVYTDACLSPAPSVGVFCAGGFVSLSGAALAQLALPLPPAGSDINVWECFAVLVAVHLFAAWWRGARVLVLCDNASTVAWLTGGAPRPQAARVLVQALFGLCVQWHVRLAVQHIPGESNVLADALSRRQWGRFGTECAAALGVDSPFLSCVLPALQG